MLPMTLKAVVCKIFIEFRFLLFFAFNLSVSSTAALSCFLVEQRESYSEFNRRSKILFFDFNLSIEQNFEFGPRSFCLPLFNNNRFNQLSNEFLVAYWFHFPGELTGFNF